jgi:hypothetical protein
MNKIPVTFEHEGKEYSGTLKEVSGAGAAIGSHWHLMVDNFYWGQLLYLKTGFVFYAQTGDMRHLSEQLGEAVKLWYE